MRKTAIFGGSFDPPTNAHYALGVQLSRRFDRVIVVPAYISPFKKAGAELDGTQRIKLLRDIFAPFPNVEVSDCEIAAKGTSYSYMTAQRFKEEGTQLYFVIGSDGLGSLDKWARTDILKETVEFYVVERPFFPVKEAELIAARKILNVTVAPFKGEEGSSSLLKVAVAFGKEREVVPDTVADYIEENALYRDYDYIVSAYPRFNLKKSRIDHVYRTAKAAILLAKLNGADTEKTIRAALLHDIAKYLTREDLDKEGIEFTPQMQALPAPCVHQLTGAAVAKKVFNESDEVTAAIATHCTGGRNMTLLQKIVFAADYIEEGRDFDGLDRIRQAVYDDIDKGIKLIYENTIAFLRASGQEVAPATIDAYEYLKSHKEKI